MERDRAGRGPAQSDCVNSDPAHWQRRSQASVDVKYPLSLCGILRLALLCDGFRRTSLGLPTAQVTSEPKKGPFLTTSKHGIRDTVLFGDDYPGRIPTGFDIPAAVTVIP